MPTWPIQKRLTRKGKLNVSRQAAASAPLRLVAIGGGTGLSALLRGLKRHVVAEPALPLPAAEKPYLSDLAAIVTVTDDGGSSGRLRRELKVLPPGDIRNCLVAMSEDEALMSLLFRYRFNRGRGLTGHSFGNLFLAALTRITGDFAEAVKLSSEVLAIRGRIFPSTAQNVTLLADMADGKRVAGETRISRGQGRIRRMHLVPAACVPLPETLQAIAHADIITVGPGSLFTSLIPNVLVRGVPEAIAASRAVKIYVSNLMTQPGETDGFSIADHIRAIYAHSGRPLFDYAIINSAPISPGLSSKYQKRHAAPVLDDSPALEALGVRPVHGDLVAEHGFVRHDSDRVARLILETGRKKRRPRSDAALAQ